MSYLWHDLMSYLWGLLFVLGLIVGAIAWVAMALWENLRRLFRKISGEIDTPADPKLP